MVNIMQYVKHVDVKVKCHWEILLIIANELHAINTSAGSLYYNVRTNVSKNTMNSQITMTGFVRFRIEHAFLKTWQNCCEIV